MKQINSDELNSVRRNSKLISQRVAEMKANNDRQYQLLTERPRMLRYYETRGERIGNYSDETLQEKLNVQGVNFRRNAVTTAAEAAQIILAGVRNNEWRILVGPDAQNLDKAVRADPLSAYDATFNGMNLNRDNIANSNDSEL